MERDNNTTLVREVEQQAEHFENQMAELSELQLAIVGGGSGEITTH